MEIDPRFPLRQHFRHQPFWNPTQCFAHEQGQRIHRMDLNECPYPPSPKVLAAIQAAASRLNRYPDGTCPILTPRIARRIGVNPEQISWGTGSSQLLTSIVTLSINPGEQLLAPALIWRRFAGVFDVVAADVCAVANQANGGIDVDGLLAALTDRTRLMVVLTPNNPTGMMLSEAELTRLICDVPEHVLLFIDEAYYEFARFAGGPDAVEILRTERSGPWVVTRTFSKAYALAGLRLGYAICSSEEIVNALRLITSTFNLCGIAEAAALAALDDPEYTQMILTTTARERERLQCGLEAMGLTVMPSVTNFLGVDLGRESGPIIKALRDRRIRVAGFGYEAAGNYLRISTGFPEDSEAFLQALNVLLAS